MSETTHRASAPHTPTSTYQPQPTNRGGEVTCFDTTTLRRSTGFTKWKTVDVIDDTPKADRATFVRAEQLVDEIEGLIADVGLNLGTRSSHATLEMLSSELASLVRDLRDGVGGEGR